MTLISSVTQWVWPIVIALVVILVLAIVIWWIKTRNAFVMLSHNVEEGFSTIDVSLKKRYDLIPNLVETVKGYATHEKETLSAVMSARSMALNAKSPDEKIAAEKTTRRRYSQHHSSCRSVPSAQSRCAVYYVAATACYFGERNFAAQKVL